MCCAMCWVLGPALEPPVVLLLPVAVAEAECVVLLRGAEVAGANSLRGCGAAVGPAAAACACACG